MTEPGQSYQEIVAQHNQDKSPAGRYYEILFQELYAVAGDHVALNAFRVSLTSSEQRDLEWWRDELLRQFEQYQNLVRTMMERARTLQDGVQEESEPQDTLNATRQLFQAMSGRLKARWKAVAYELGVAYALAGSPYGPGNAAVQQWASEQLPIRRAVWEKTREQFLNELRVEAEAAANHSQPTTTPAISTSAFTSGTVAVPSPDAVPSANISTGPGAISDER